MIWIYLTLLAAILLTASLIALVKLKNGKYIFEHFSYLLTSGVLFVVAGGLFVVLQNDSEFCYIF